MAHKFRSLNREISWLSFNARVLQEAEDPAVPLLDRIRFLGIFSNNQDEFFRVRVATLRRMVVLGKQARSLLDVKPQKILDKINGIVLEQQKKFEAIYVGILEELNSHGIHIIDETQVTPDQGEFVTAYFREKVRPALVPIMLRLAPTFPELNDRSIYFAINLSRAKKEKEKPDFALLELPTDTVSRFVVLPKQGGETYIMLLDDVIRYCLKEIFSLYNYASMDAYTIKVTRDAELDLDNDISKSMLEKIDKSVKDRQWGEPVRFVYDADLPKPLMKYVMKRLNLGDDDTVIPGGRYHNFKDFMDFPKVNMPSLEYRPAVPVPHPRLEASRSMERVIRERDVLLHYPYQSFNYLIDLLREAAIDPRVESIHITMYRVASDSKVINALISAVRNGKLVTVVVELRARFDEEANILWSKKLQEEGVRVIFGVPGLKVHGKLCLITYREGKKKVSRVAGIGTGNFHEKTAKIYADHSLFTAHPGIAAEVEEVFNFLETNYRTTRYKHLLVSPLYMRKTLDKLMKNEMDQAKRGLPASIDIKMNNIVDTTIIRRLYAASKAGVKIRIIVRGNCSLVPGVEGLSENIEAISIIDRYLEHSRYLIFHNGGNPLYYISSADLMTRNLDYRVEVACPIYDLRLQAELRAMFEIQWQDNVKARLIDADFTNEYRKLPEARKKVRSQEAFYTYLKETQTDR
ncbi:MAG TPA: polyphosphate kinase 1 [Thermoanaerobaculia bacterium]|nr:polyphosphate kinase 1 [Thermoanaerobaculia bacterium]HUM30077.1 polyphosphate kinase 1 [Thermoanaerobaculia bacterium]HXK69427.1 polyphosphate kinase 1 [Thermoanaerobaculia bacterium]